MLHPIIHDRDPYIEFKKKQYIERIRKDCNKNPTIFQDLIEKHLLSDGGNKIKFTMKGKEKFVEDLLKEEEKRFYTTLKGLKAEDIKKIVEDNEKVNKRLAEDSDLSILPRSSINDLPLKNFPNPKKSTLDNGVPVWRFEEETSGVTNVAFKFDISGTADHLKPYISTFAK